MCNCCAALNNIVTVTLIVYNENYSCIARGLRSRCKLLVLLKKNYIVTVKIERITLRVYPHFITYFSGDMSRVRRIYVYLIKKNCGKTKRDPWSTKNHVSIDQLLATTDHCRHILLCPSFEKLSAIGRYTKI